MPHRKRLCLGQRLLGDHRHLHVGAAATIVEGKVRHIIGRPPFQRGNHLRTAAFVVGAGGLDGDVKDLIFWQDQFGCQTARRKPQRGRA